ncbi:hypothetical protein ANACOL_00775 [Anaerotruncus colihominis DSM 17241]|uniref:Uncharacterized protein n=1 Tax=Anaerotruncus colihominis DSM 17241 TaxID=445972 RepID=B0P7P0_9FIRM|nr:hypothetical protein ANACOL_00775 [Anaerotruncus colihominis DSM 17241]
MRARFEACGFSICYAYRPKSRYSIAKASPSAQADGPAFVYKIRSGKHKRFCVFYANWL